MFTGECKEARRGNKEKGSFLPFLGKVRRMYHLPPVQVGWNLIT